MAEMTELLPCPFCGGEARIFELTWTDGLGVPHDFKHPYYRVVCQGGCRTLKGDYDTEAEAIAAWNTRTERVDERETNNKTGDIVTHDSQAERTCKMRADGAHCMNGVEFYECRFCGEYACIPTVMGKSEPPNYCPWCGAKVVGE